MSRITDFFNRIFRRNTQKRLDAPVQEHQPTNGTKAANPAPRQYDQTLLSQLDIDMLNRFQDPRVFNEYCVAYFGQGNTFAQQYDYVDLIQTMEQNGAMNDYMVYQDYILGNQSLYYPSKVHGIDHTSRVTLFAEMLTMIDNIPPHEKYLIMNAAVLHDIGRGDDRKDFDHGRVGAQKIRDLHVLENFSPRDRDIICFAVGAHSLEPDQIEQELLKIPPQDRQDYRLVLDYLQDADKLDRVRIANKGWGLDPNRLATPTAHRLVKAAHQNFYQFDRVMHYERNRDQIRAHRDFIINCYNEIRRKDFNIPFSDFEAIVNEYNPGTLEMLASQGRITDIFTYDTFRQYGKKADFNESIKFDPNGPDLSFEGIFEDTKRNMTTALLPSTLNSEFMLLYNLKKNKPANYSILMTQDVDTSYKYLVGVASVVNMGDIIAMRDSGYPFRISDFMHLASKYPPEEVREILDTKRYDELVSDKRANPYQIIDTKQRLKRYNINYPEEYFKKNFRYIEAIVQSYPELLTRPEISNYTFPEIFAACQSVKSARDKIFERKGRGANGQVIDETYSIDVPDSIDNILKYLQFFKQVNAKQFLEDEKRLDVIFEVGDETEALGVPSFIEYLTKTHKPYEATDLRQKVFYKQYCTERVLNDPNLTLDEAKEKMLLGLFEFNVPGKYLKEFEQEFMRELHYHGKYLGNSEYERVNSDIFANLRTVFDAKSMEEFRQAVSAGKNMYDSFNLALLQQDMKQHLMEISKKDITNQLKQTEQTISSIRPQEVLTTDGRRVSVRVLSGQDFAIATSTQLPKCSAQARDKSTRAVKSTQEIQGAIMNGELYPRNVCTSISSQSMLARASAARSECDLVYGYVPMNPEQISISANYDLSSTRVTTKNNDVVRQTNRPTSYLTVADQVAQTVEEHNETVMDAYPRYIFCYDEVTPLALQKQQQINAQYKRDGVKPPIEIVLIQARDVYLPKIKQDIVNEHEAFLKKYRSGILSYADFDRAFLNKESNIITRTLQAVNSTTIKEDYYRFDNFHADILESLTQIIEEVARDVPPDRAKAFSDSIQLLVDRGDSSTELGSRYYNEYYLDDIPTSRLRQVQRGLLPRYADRENITERSDNRTTDPLERTDPMDAVRKGDTEPTL